MNTGIAVFFGLTLIAMAILATDGLRSATASSGQIDRYIGSGGPGYIVFMTDTVTGRFRRCNTNGGKCEQWYEGAR